MSRLADENSPYLRHAAHQKIDWYPWSEEAFEKARREGKPVFLSSGGIWCHWCHVMARECFENEEIAQLLNEHCVSIKLDRDERPDIDRIYQQAVAAMGSGGGWPLSVFLTHDKRPFFGGTYFPPEDGLGRPGFKKVIRAVSEFYSEKQGEIGDYTKRLIEYLRAKPHPHADMRQESLHEAVTTILAEFDHVNGGFGSAPKFPTPGAMEFLMSRSFFTDDPSMGEAVRKTLTKMARGGYCDQLGGGFHRYSVDESWIVPHFEKMAEDNAWLLMNYAKAYHLFGDDAYRSTAEGIIGFVRSTLSDPEGGFYASQDADVVPEDEGGYFTWTEDDLRRVLNNDEYTVVSLRFMDPQGSMHHDSSKRVLFVAADPEEIAEKTGRPRETVMALITSGREKLLSERNTRQAPFVDTTLYTSLNGLMIAAYLRAFSVLKVEYLRVFALQSLRRIMALRCVGGELFHSEGVKGLLEDYVHLINALTEAYTVTGERGQLDDAVTLMDRALSLFWDDEDGGFFDAEGDLLGIRLKGIEDIPHPSANALAVLNLVRLHVMTGKGTYREKADSVLKAFHQRAEDIGIHSAYYHYALEAYFRLVKLTVEADPLSELAEAARTVRYPHVAVAYGGGKGRVVPCLGERCFEPLYNSDALKAFVDGLRNA